MPEPVTSEPLDQATVNRLMVEARTHIRWQDKAVPDALLTRLVDILKMGPTSANCSPARIIFIKSVEAKERLRPLLAQGNVEKTMTAPVTAIIGHDMEFYEHLTKLFPHTDARSWFVGDEPMIEATAFRNGSLQGAYLIIAARMLGLDVGPMSGFDETGVDAEFFAGTTYKSNFLCNIGYGDPVGLHPRLPRFTFDEIAKIL